MKITFPPVNQNTLEKPTVVYCDVIPSLLFSLPTPHALQFVMVSPKVFIIRTGNTSLLLSLPSPPLYLQQDHQQLLIVPRGVTADVFLQLAAELWRKEERSG